MTNLLYKEIINSFNEYLVSLYYATRKLESLISIEPQWINCCIASCCAFTSIYEELEECPECGKPRYFETSGKRRSCKKMAFFSLKNRLLMQYKNPAWSQELQYQNEYTRRQNYQNESQYSDIFNGDQYKRLVEEGHFPDYRDVALMASLDGYQIFKQKTDDCWVILFLNANIKPEDWVKKHNLLIGAIIPSPQAPHDFNSFLQPIQIAWR